MLSFYRISLYCAINWLIIIPQNSLSYICHVPQNSLSFKYTGLTLLLDVYSLYGLWNRYDMFYYWAILYDMTPHHALHSISPPDWVLEKCCVSAVLEKFPSDAIFWVQWSSWWSIGLVTERLRVRLTPSPLQATLSKLLTYCVLRPTQPPTLSRTGNE